MKKKLTILIVLLVVVVAFAGCEKRYTPDPAVEQFLGNGMTAEGAFAQIAKVDYKTTITVQDKQGNEQGTNVLEVEFDKSGDSITYSAHQTYTGMYVSDNIVEVTATITKDESGYVYDTLTKYVGSNDPVHETKHVEDSFVLDLITALVYIDNGAYNAGGLYYGDIFAQRIYRYPTKFFSVNEQENICVFDGKMMFDVKGVGETILSQTIKVNELGLLLYFYEKYDSVKGDYVMNSETVPHYEYTTTAA